MRARSLCSISAYLVFPAMLFAEPSERNTLVGVWELTRSQAGQQPTHPLGLATFSTDGSLMMTAEIPTENKTNPVLQAVDDDMGAGYGRWIQIGDREFRLTCYSTLLKTGLVNGFSTVQSTVLLSQSGDVNLPGTYTGSTNAIGINAAGDIVGFYSDINFKLYGFLLRNGVFRLVAPYRSTSTAAFGINLQGDIVGFYSDASGLWAWLSPGPWHREDNRPAGSFGRDCVS
jgi:hypothetical protein